MLNHRSVTPSTLTAIYDRYRSDKEKRAALGEWTEVLSGIVDAKPARTTAPARRARRQNVYEFKARVLRRAGDRAREEVGCASTQPAESFTPTSRPTSPPEDPRRPGAVAA